MRITDYPKTIESKVKELAALIDKILAARDTVRDLEMSTTSEVLEAKNGDGKARYTSEKARDLAVHQTLAKSKGYKDAVKNLRQLEHSRTLLEASIDRLRRELRIATIDYEREQLGQRAA